MHRYEESSGWEERTLIFFHYFLLGFKTTVQLLLLGLFWAVVVPSLMNKDFLITPHHGGFIRGIIAMCVKPSMENLIRRIISVVVVNLIFNLIVRYGKIKFYSYNIWSAIAGFVILLINSYPRNILLIVGFAVVIFLLLKRIKYLLDLECDVVKPVYLISFIMMVLLILGELFFSNHQIWLENRGIIMMMVMKAISMSHEEFTIHTLSYAEVFGYLLCPASILFGPWMNIDKYRMNYAYHSQLNWKWALKIVQLFTNAMIFMVIGNCLNRTLLPAEGVSPFFSKWIEAFRNAFAFRASNYFINYMGEFTMITAGFNKLYGKDGGRWKFTVCRPLSVEFPRSMAIVGRNWNIPLYNFLKDIIYTRFAELNFGSAVIFTFFLCAMLVGMNVRITAILISLGILSVAQFNVQNWLSNKFSSCCKIEPCSDECDHVRRRFHPITMIINGVNVVLNMIHLAYLGYIMDEKFEATSLMDLFFTWKEDLYFFTHNIIFFLVTNMTFLR